MWRRARITTSSATLAATFVALLVLCASAQAHLAAPRLQSPSNKSKVQALPAFTWTAVRGAASYQFEFSADRNFSSGVNGFGTGPVGLQTTAITNDQTIPDGTYYWRVRAVTAQDVPGPWSTMRKLTKHWSSAPRLLSPVHKTVDWPSSTLLLKWTTVPHAVNYEVTIATSPSLADPVFGPTQVQGPEYAFPSVLAPDTYYWAVQPVDAAGQLGVRSAVKSFTWAWPSNTTLSETDVSPDSSYEEPSFSWTPVPGASRYELQVATDPTYPNNAIILDASSVLGTTYTATNFFPNHTTLYWRLRAIDTNGDAGAWNDGQSFTESFDAVSPSIQNLHVVDQDGNAVDGQTTTDPIIRWSPVPGASAYTLTFAPWSAEDGCDFNSGIAAETTPETAWTVGAGSGSNGWESSEFQWPSNADGGGNVALGYGSYCVSVVAFRSDSPLQGSTITSDPTVLGDALQAAFTYGPATVSGTLGATTATYSPGLVPPAAGAGGVDAGSTLSTTPLLEWQPVQGADGYFVVIANDEGFDPNSIVTGAYTTTTAWVPPLSLQDQTGDYWWEVIPVSSSEANGQPLLSTPESGAYLPQPFDKSSTPPVPVSPVNDANAATQPTFTWRSAQGAVNYTLEIAADPSFANPLETDTTDSTSYTSVSTLPAGKTLYWRVRANDISHSLNWSATQTFTHNLPAPSPSSKSPSGGSTIPQLSWTPVSGATAYNVMFTTGGGSQTVSVGTPYLTPTEFLNPGITDWRVQAVFPGGATSAFSSQKSYKRTIPAPNGIHATKAGSRILVTWNPDPIAKEYVIQLSTTTGFDSPIVSDTTANTAWVPQITPQQAAEKLYWRLAVVDAQGNVGAFHIGVFQRPGASKRKSKGKGKSKPKGK